MLRNLSTTSFNKNAPIDYCVNLVKSRDYENYLCLSLLSQDAQEVGFTVRAFNIEVAQVQETTSIAQTAKMRIDFWRQNISRTFEGFPPNHPVAISLALCLEKQMLTEKWFHKIVDIREKYINNTAFMSLDDAEEYGEYTLSSIFYLIMEGMGLEQIDASYAASHLGVACSLVTLMRSTPYFANNSQVILPTELLFKHKLSQEDVIRRSNQPALQEAIYEIASQAHLHLDGMKKLFDNVPPTAKNVYLPYFPCDMFLKHIQKLDFNVFHPSWNKRHWSLPALLWYKSKKHVW